MLELIGRAYAQGTAIPSIPAVTGVATFREFFGRVITVVLIVAGALAVIYLIYGGILYITAAGDQEKATAGRTAIVNAIIGIIIIALAFAIVAWVTNAIQGTV